MNDLHNHSPDMKNSYISMAETALLLSLYLLETIPSRWADMMAWTCKMYMNGTLGHFGERCEWQLCYHRAWLEYLCQFREMEPCFISFIIVDGDRIQHVMLDTIQYNQPKRRTETGSILTQMAPESGRWCKTMSHGFLCDPGWWRSANFFL